MANTAPLNELCKVVADFLFIHVVNPMELRDLHGRPGVHFEIEAKLGCLVDRDHSGARIQLPVQSEVALSVVQNPHYNFSSSMTEVSSPFYLGQCYKRSRTDAECPQIAATQKLQRVSQLLGG